MLKETWRESLDKTEVNIKYLLDVNPSCAILHNVLLNQGENDLNCLHGLIDKHNLDDFRDENLGEEVYNDVQNVPLQHHGDELRRQLASFLGS